MKRTIAALVLTFIFVSTFSQTWKPGFGIEGGMGSGGMTALLKTANPVIVDNSELKKGWAYSYGAFVQFMRPGYGFETRINLNSYSAEAESFSTPESISMKYMSVPLLFKIRLSSKEGITTSSWTDESYSLIGNTIYHTPGQYSAGGNPFTTNVYLYAGGQYDMLNKATHTFGTPTGTTEDISTSLLKSGYSMIGGLEFTINMLSFDFSYQKSMKSVYPGTDNKVSAFFVKIRLRII